MKLSIIPYRLCSKKYKPKALKFKQFKKNLVRQGLVIEKQVV